MYQFTNIAILIFNGWFIILTQQLKKMPKTLIQSSVLWIWLFLATELPMHN
jgi:hypothetical protein